MKPGQQIIRVYKQSELRNIEHGFKEAVSVVRTDMDSTFATVENVACKSGCAHCCKLRVEVLPPEVALIVDYVRNNFPAPLRQTILDKLKSNAEAEDASTPDEYRAADLRCAFLGDNDLCMVYEQRPLTCRGFGSTDVSVCDLSKEDDGNTTFSAAPQSLMLMVATSGLFWTGFHRAALDYWRGLPVEVKVSEEAIRVVLETRERLEKASRDRRNGALAHPAR